VLGEARELAIFTVCATLIWCHARAFSFSRSRCVS